MLKLFTLTALFLTFTVQAKSLKFMQYNAENLFDTKFDIGTLDYTYLPLSVKHALKGHADYCNKLENENRRNECLLLDWNEEKLNKKIANISKVVKAFDETGKGADIVVFQELENKNVLNMLVTRGLDKMGYKSLVLIEGADSRGIDVALISKFPVISSKMHSLFMNGTKLDTRGILEVTLNVEGKRVVVFVNHWPSQSNPAEERVASAVLLEKAASLHKRADLIIAAGDFNTIKTDSPYPFEKLVNFIDTEDKARESHHSIHPGTHYFRGVWKSLDKIFVHKSSSIRPDYSKFQIFNHSFLMKTDHRSGDLVPMRFNHDTGEGFSDHLPVGIEFIY